MTYATIMVRHGVGGRQCLCVWVEGDPNTAEHKFYAT